MASLTHRTQAHIREVAGTARLESAIRAIRRRLVSGQYAQAVGRAAGAAAETVIYSGQISDVGVDYSSTPPASGHEFESPEARIANIESYGLTPLVNEVAAARSPYPSLAERIAAVAASVEDALTLDEHLAIGNDPPHHAQAHGFGSTSDHSDVDFSGKADGDVVYWDNGVGKFKPKAVVEPTYTLDDLIRARKTFEQVLRGTATSAGALAGGGTMKLIRLNASDNKGCFVESAAWSENAVSCYTVTGGRTLEVYFTTSGGTATIWQTTSHVTEGDSTANTVHVDGVLHGTWDQSADASYTISGLAAGVHVVKLTAVIGAGESDTYFGEIVYPVNGATAAAATACYVGREVEDDEVKILSSLDQEVFAYSLGNGRTSNQVTHVLRGAAAFGEGVAHRLPIPSGVTDQTLAASTILESGKALNDYDVPPVRRFGLAGLYTTTTAVRKPFMPGQYLKMGAAGSRGCALATPTGDDYFLCQVADELNAAIMCATAFPLLCVVMTPGSGSAFSEGELVLAIVVTQWSDARNELYAWALPANAVVACGLYRLEALP